MLLLCPAHAPPGALVQEVGGGQEQRRRRD